MLREMLGNPLPKVNKLATCNPLVMMDVAIDNVVLDQVQTLTPTRQL